MSTVVVIEPPTDLVVSVEEAKGHLSVDFDDDDGLIEALIKVATTHIDGPDGWLGRALAPQTLELRLDAFPTCEVRLPYPPLIDVLSVKYDDVNGTEKALAQEFYRAVGSGANTRLVLAYGQSLPAPRWQPECVRIRYNAGWPVVLDGDGEDPARVWRGPAPIKHAILLMVGHFYENREAVVASPTAVEMPIGAEALLSTYRVFGL